MLSEIGFGNDFVLHAVVSLLIIVMAFILSKVLQRIAIRYIEEPARRYRASKLIGRTAAVITLIILLIYLSPKESDLITILTVIGAGLAIGLREVLLNFVGWINLAVRSTFEQGDRIEVNGVKGDVVDIRLMQSTLMEVGGWVEAEQSTGRIVHFPNSWVFQHTVYNYTRGFKFVWHEFGVTVTYRSDWEAARDIMLEHAEESAAIVEHQAKQELRRMSREYLVHYSILTPYVYVRLTENGIRLTLRYLTQVRKRRGTEHALTMAMLADFASNDNIELAYPMAGVTTFPLPQFGSQPDVLDNGSEPMSTGSQTESAEKAGAVAQKKNRTGK